jgi:flagellar hook protein FlgE
MGLTSAMYTGLTGLSVNQTRIQTIGHNLANVNTNAFKGSRTMFQTQFSQLLTAGAGPSETSGGVNPMQIGLGANIAATQRNLTQGAIETTAIPSDLAIEGAGFFIVQRAGGQQAYTRDGSFSVDTANRLVSVDGSRVLGFGVDEEFNIQPNILQELVIPLGTESLARATESVMIDGDLSADGTIATQGSRHVTQALVSGGGAAAGAGTRLTDLRSADDPGVTLFADGSVVTLAGVTRNGRSIPAQTFVVGTDGSTLGDLAGWMQSTLGIQDGNGVPGAPGVVIENGALVINSNAGLDNGIEIRASDLSTDNPAAPAPLSFTLDEAANGSSVATSFTVYDSLGTPVNVGATFVLESLTDLGPVWRYYLDSYDSDPGAPAIGTGTVSFDNSGNVRAVDGADFQLDRAGSGAASPLSFTLDLSSVNGLSTAASAVVMSDQDGFPPGTLSTYSVGPDGVINGTFSNGLTRSLGQVALAVFSNPEGLVAEAQNVYLQGPNSGEPLVTSPQQFAAGRILGGALELSNVDMAREFIGLITSSTGFQAASRVISTSNDLLDQLLLIVR